MSAPLHQLTLTFDPIEDRMLLRIGTAKNTEYHLWLTRRFIKVLWEALMKVLDRTIEFQEPRAKQDKNIEKGMGNADKDTIEEGHSDGAGQDNKKGADNDEVSGDLNDGTNNDDIGNKSSQLVRNKVKAIEHKEAIQTSDFSKKHSKGNVNLTSKSGPLLVVGCRVKSLNEQNTLLSLKTADGRGIQFGLNKKLLHALCHMMVSSSNKAQWNLVLEVGDPKVFAPDMPEGVVH